MSSTPEMDPFLAQSTSLPIILTLFTSDMLCMLQTMYDNMKIRVDNAVERGKVGDEYMTGEEERRAFNRWTEGFTRQDHPTVIQVCINVNMAAKLPASLAIYVRRAVLQHEMCL